VKDEIGKANIIHHIIKVGLCPAGDRDLLKAFK
jgi:hypothetical protein